jgi:hypothetical protein
MPPNTVRVCRPGKWGNPYIVGVSISQYSGKICDQQEAVDEFQDDIENGLLERVKHADLKELRGKNLACWCRLDQPCHADVLLSLANTK